MVYTINAIDSLNARFWQAIRVNRANVTGKTGYLESRVERRRAVLRRRITKNQRRSPPIHEITTVPLLHRRIGHDTG